MFREGRIYLETRTQSLRMMASNQAGAVARCRGCITKTQRIN